MLHCGDITAAFLQGLGLARVLIMSLPKMMFQEFLLEVCWLQRNLFMEQKMLHVDFGDPCARPC